ncbi:MAG: P-loop NTPase [Eubacteriales bacterium]|nr:P-loop NTPase [Eubacteriales bacterium]
MAEEHRKNPNEIEKIDLTVYMDDAWVGIKKMWFLCLLIIAACAAGMGYYRYKNYSPIYEAHTTFVIGAYSVFEDDANEYYDTTTATEMAKTFPFILKSSQLNRKICQAMGESYIPESITVSTEADKTSILTMKVASHDPQRAYDILQAVIQNYSTVAEPIIGSSTMTIMDESGVPTTPSNPRSLRDSVRQGAILGAILSVLLIALYALTRKTVRREEDLKRHVSLENLGYVPTVKMKSRSRKDHQQVIFEGRNSVDSFNENIRGIRNRVEKAMKDHDKKSILVTSAMANEGKTTMAVNLAIALAKKNKRVILLDADLRNPSIYKLFDSDTGQSMQFRDVIPGTDHLIMSVRQYENLPLMMIFKDPATIEADQPLMFEKVSEVEAADICEKLKFMCDYLILDTPPVGLVSDTIDAARYIDTAIFVVRQDYTPIDQILQAIDTIKETDTDIIGYIMNNAKEGITSQGYGRNYGYGYGRYGNYGKYGKYGSYGNYGRNHNYDAFPPQGQHDPVNLNDQKYQEGVEDSSTYLENQNGRRYHFHSMEDREEQPVAYAWMEKEE